MTLLLIALALVVLVLFLFFAGPNVWRPRFRRRWGQARFGRGPGHRALGPPALNRSGQGGTTGT